MAGRSKREDVLVSVSFSDLPCDPDTFAAIASLAEVLDARFRFREIVVVADADTHEDYLPLVRTIPNLRLLAVQPGCGYYGKRLVAAEEAIGDVILLTRMDEVASFDPVEMIERAVDEKVAVLAVRPPALGRKSLWAPAIILGRVAGFKIGPRDLQSVALPRTMLNELLAHSDPELALRFLPRDPRFPLQIAEVRPEMLKSGGGSIVWSRLQLVQKLLVYLAPALLTLVTAFAFLLAILGIGFGAYALGAWLIIDNLARGWLTISLMLSMTAIFLGLSILGLSLGLQHVITREKRDKSSDLAQEVNRIDLFGQVSSDLNVDASADKMASLRGHPGAAQSSEGS